jgi:3-methyladenine DNA glycosylase AlkD
LAGSQEEALPVPVVTEAIVSQINSLGRERRTPQLRKIAREAARHLVYWEGESILTLSEVLIDLEELGEANGARAVGFELAHHHRAARDTLNWRWLERLGSTLDGWASVDHFARKLSGPAWQHGQITDARVRRWATSSDFWWRRAGLVSTIALNERRLGKGDAARTLAICELFIDDRADLHVKALSWALRELAIRDPDAVIEYIIEREDRLAPRVLREVRNKIDTGHKMAKPSEAMMRRMRERRASR